MSIPSQYDAKNIENKSNIINEKNKNKQEKYISATQGRRPLIYLTMIFGAACGLLLSFPFKFLKVLIIEYLLL